MSFYVPWEPPWPSLEVGLEVTVSSGAWTKTTVVPPAGVKKVNTPAGIVRGWAAPHAQGELIATGPTEDDAVLALTANHKGRFKVKFKKAGYDLAQYTGLEIRQYDPDGDRDVFRSTINSCLVVLDEDTIDKGILSIEQAAWGHGVESDWLVNDHDPVEYDNPWLNWNLEYPGDAVLLPAGAVDDEGWFALPEQIRAVDGSWKLPIRDTKGNKITNSEQWISSYIAGRIKQEHLDKVADVVPIGNQDLAALIGRTCVAIVHDSDISMNYAPIYANLQGARYGRFAFTVLGVEVPGSIPESASDSSLYGLWLRVERPQGFTLRYDVTVRDGEPDTIEISKAEHAGGRLTVWGTSGSGPGAEMTVSVDGADAGSDPGVAPFILEAPMTYNAVKGRYEFVHETPVDLDGRRVTVSSDQGGAHTANIE
jgi:hypothetical protein